MVYSNIDGQEEFGQVSSEDELIIQNHLGSPLAAVPPNTPSTSSTIVENGFESSPNSLPPIPSPISPIMDRNGRMLRRSNESCRLLLLLSSSEEETTPKFIGGSTSTNSQYKYTVPGDQGDSCSKYSQ